MSNYQNMKCEACRAGAPPATAEERNTFVEQHPGWSIETIDGEPRLIKTYTFDDFAQALAFTQKVGELAESEGHHPALLTEWGKVTVHWWTHKIGDLHQNDLIAAAKTDAL